MRLTSPNGSRGTSGSQVSHVTSGSDVKHGAPSGRARLRRQLRVAVPALAATALLVTALSGAASASGPVYVAIGDSYTSGPLIPLPTGSPLGCARSTHNYPHLVATAIGASSFTDASCQGADSTNITGSQSVPFGTAPPEDSALSASTTVVTYGIGGNDINFDDIVIECTELSVTNPFGSPCKNHYTSGGVDQLAAAIKAAAPKIAANLQVIHAHAPNARVFVVGYPAIVPNTGDGCWPVVPFAEGDVPYLRGVENELNAMLATEAAANNATYVDVYTPSIGHDACQKTGVRWVEGLVPTSPAAPFHPNQLGEAGMAKAVEAAING
jgi:lysophospholipase L1-like esterase